MKKKYSPLLLGILAGSLLCRADADAPAPPRAPAQVMGVEGADWLERPDRDAEQKPDDVIKLMGLKKGDVVADIGCGTGYFARRIAKVVGPEGKVYGQDIQPEMLELLKKYCAKEDIHNVEPVLGSEDDPKLPKASLDWMILVDVYHEFQKPQAMLAKLKEALKPEGKVCLVEYRNEDDTAKHIKAEHRMSVKQVLAEWNPAGFELEDLREFLPTQHVFIFGIRAGAGKTAQLEPLKFSKEGPEAYLNPEQRRFVTDYVHWKLVNVGKENEKVKLLMRAVDILCAFYANKITLDDAVQLIPTAEPLMQVDSYISSREWELPEQFKEELPAEKLTTLMESEALKGDLICLHGLFRYDQTGDGSFGEDVNQSLHMIFRVIYLYMPDMQRLDMLDIYGKNEKDDLAPQEKAVLKELARTVRDEAKNRFKRHRNV